MKKMALVFLMLVFTITPLSACTKDTDDNTLVYKTTSGAKYHRIDCRYVKGKEIEITLSKAIKSGLAPCKVCDPPTKKQKTTSLKLSSN